MLRKAVAIGRKRQERATSPSNENGGVTEEEKRPARQPLPDKEEIRGWVRELTAGLTGDDKTTVEEARRLCCHLALPAAERLGLVITGIQPGTVPQVVMASITILKGAGIVGKSDAGITAETAME
jgi:hypothetical protein